MNRPKPEQVTLEGEEKEKYLGGLDRSLSILVDVLRSGANETQQKFLAEFGQKEKWDFSRIPDQNDSYKDLANLVDSLRDGCKWLRWDDSNKDLRDNKGYFSDVEVSTSSGLPGVFNFVSLERIRREAEQRLAEVPSYEDDSLQLRRLLLEDAVGINDVSGNARDLHRQAMKRNFLEKIGNVDLLSWRMSGEDIRVDCEKILPFGGEDLWRLSFLKSYPADALFEAYVVDVWQDLREPQITEEGKISDELRSLVTGFVADNFAWYLLRELDEKFESLHPVHVSKALIGPYENRYLLKPKSKPLVDLREMLKANPDAGLLRFSRRYAYAPNHEDIQGKLRQKVYRENWSDEVVICPTDYTGVLSKSLLGTSLRIIGA